LSEKLKNKEEFEMIMSKNLEGKILLGVIIVSRNGKRGFVITSGFINGGDTYSEDSSGQFFPIDCGDTIADEITHLVSRTDSEAKIDYFRLAQSNGWVKTSPEDEEIARKVFGECEEIDSVYNLADRVIGESVIDGDYECYFTREDVVRDIQTWGVVPTPNDRLSKEGQVWDYIVKYNKKIIVSIDDIMINKIKKFLVE
jgi:hypothetical protein